MRSDMGKVITERERSGSWMPSQKDGVHIHWKGHDADYDNHPRMGKMSAGGQYSWEQKQPTDVLGPLIGYIRKQVGRPWDKIYSELCANLDKRKTTHAHVFTHVFQWVGRSVVRCSDGVYREPNDVHGFYDKEGKWQITGMAPEFYVHPKTGLLRRNKVETKAMRKARYGEKPKNDLIKLEAGEYRKLDGIWFYLRIREASWRERHLPQAVTMDQKVYWIEEKRQLGKKELKKVREMLEA